MIVQRDNLDRCLPSVGDYGTKLWNHPSTLNENGWVYIDMPVRYALGWIDLLNAREKEQVMPDRDTLMMALDQVLAGFPERDPEGHDLPLNMLWDAVTYIESLREQVSKLGADNQSKVSTISSQRQTIEAMKKEMDHDKKTIQMLRGENDQLRLDVKGYKAKCNKLMEEKGEVRKWLTNWLRSANRSDRSNRKSRNYPTKIFARLGGPRSPKSASQPTSLTAGLWHMRSSSQIPTRDSNAR